MSEYLVLARKYRSLTFSEVIGQEPIAETLVNAIRTSRVAHAYLFTGTRGVGKTTMARILAKALNCLSSDAPTAEPCNKCEACIAIGRGDDIDVIEIDGASNRGIDEIRELRANAIFRPARCRYKVYYIDEVHMLTREAFNALLKTLEEPPGHVKFVFATTECEKVPATIISRCQRFDFRNIPTRLITEHLADICKAEKVSADSDALFRVARAAAGSMRDGLSLLDQLLAGGNKVTDDEVMRILGTPPDERTLAIVTAIADGDPAAALNELSGVLEAGVALSSVTTALSGAFRNMMLACTCGVDSELIELPETQAKAIGELSQRFSVPTLVQAIGICQNVGRNIRGSSVARGLLEAALVRLAAAEKFIDPQSLLAQAAALAAGQKKKHSVAHAEAGVANPGPPIAMGGLSTQSTQSTQLRQPAPDTLIPDVSPEVTIAWNEPFVQRNWQAVIRKLFEMRAARVAGSLGPATVISLSDGTLKLAFDKAHEALRLRCDGQLRDEIQSVLGKIAGRKVSCEFVSTGESGSVDFVAPRTLSLSSAEKDQIARDPSVQMVLEMFEGELHNMTRKTPPATAPAGDEDTE